MLMGSPITQNNTCLQLTKKQHTRAYAQKEIVTRLER